MKKKIILFAIILNSLIINISNSLENKILFKINNEVVSSFDIVSEKKYIIILNSSLKKLDEESLNKLAAESIINEKIKEIEINKFFNMEEMLNNKNLENVLKDLIFQSGFETEKKFSNYLNSINLNLEYVKKKIAIEMYWNNLIYRKYNNQVVINETLIEEELKKEAKKLNRLKELNLSEILIRNKKNLDIDKLYKEILESYNSIGFESTATIYSKSDSAKYGGVIGWIKETSLSPQIIKKISKLKKDEISKPIKISENYLILKINEIKYYKKNIDISKLLEKKILFEKNQQLGRFSRAYLNKIKKNINVKEL